MPIAGYSEFELDLEAAITSQLPPLFDGVAAAPLSLANVRAIPSEAQGAYLLFYHGQLVYVGKSDAEAGLSRRLERHHLRVQHRQGLTPSAVSFRAARIYSFSVIDVETLLIRHFQSMGGAAPSWNNSGFGSNDPGRERDTQKPSKFDTAYPLDIDTPLTLPPCPLPDPCLAIPALSWLRIQLPYTLRFRDSGNEIGNAAVSPAVLFGTGITMRRVIGLLMTALPVGWQATVLQGYVILYKETRRDYKSPILIVNS